MSPLASQRGYGPKAACRIITVDPATRRIEGALRDGAMVQIKAVEVSTVFRWPLEGEIWLIRQDDGYWVLDSRMENPQDGLGDVTELNPGDTKITGNTRIAGNLTVDGTVSFAGSESAVSQYLSGLLASRPLAGTSGRYYFATDNARLYLDTGTAWTAVSQTGAKSISVSEPNESTTSSVVSAPKTLATSGELSTETDGTLEIFLTAELKSSAASSASIMFLQMNDAGTYRTIESSYQSISHDGTKYRVAYVGEPLVNGTTYRKVGTVVRIPYIAGAVQSSANKSQFRVCFYTNNASNAAWVKNMTATMIYVPTTSV